MEGREFLGCGRRWSGAGGPDVKGALLGKPPVYAPDRDFETRHVALDLDVDLRARAVSGTCESLVRARREGVRRLEFDAVGLKVSRVQVDGKPARFRLSRDKLVVSLRKELSLDAETRVVVRYSLRDPKTGLHFTSDGKQLWSQSQPEDAKRWFPCQDAPHAKATSEVRARVPAGFRAVSNGVLVAHDARGGKEHWHWRMERPHSLYLITLVVGRFSEIEDDWDGIPVVFYCEKGREADARRGLGKTAKALAFFSEKTGVRYPYPRYAQAAVAEYPGGMEHTTCTTQTDACLLDARAAKDHDMDLLVAHELAHQWFGDLLTCAEWPHAWLNEGFATYFEVLFQAHDKGRDEADYELLGNARAYLDEASRRYQRPIVCRTYLDPWTIFDRHLYEKGSWVLHMLRHELGEELWWKTVAHYLRKHKDGVVETQDLVAAIEEATGRNLQSFFDQWVYRAGHPALRARWSYDSKGKTGSLWLMQTQNVDAANAPFRLKARVRVTGRGWTRDFVEDVTEKEHRFSWRLPGAPLNVEFDPDFILLKTIALFKPVPMWLFQLSRGRTAVSRTLAAEAVAKWGGERAVAGLAAQIRRERFWGAAAEMVRALGSIRGESAERALRSLLKLSHPKVLRAVVAELGRRASPGAEKILAPMARRHPYLGVQAEATRQLGALGSPAALGSAVRNMSVPSWRDILAASAVAALASARDPRNIARLKTKALPGTTFGVRATALRALADHAALDPSLVPWLCDHAQDRDERVTLIAVSALGTTEDERALPFLEKLAKSAANPRVRVHAAESAARVKAGGSKAALKRRA